MKDTLEKAIIVSQYFHFKIKQLDFYYSDISGGTEFLTPYLEIVRRYNRA
jgi:hypothetical protein